MAQHIPIIEWINEEWYLEIIKEIKRVIREKDTSRIEILPDEYRCDNPNVRPYVPDDHHVLLYKPETKFDMLIDDENPHIKVNQCHFEIHLNRNNKIREVFVPL